MLVYTPLKYRTPLALVIGAIPGAAPPLVGWTAATGSIDAPALVLFAILLVWQIPHFLAIAWMYRDDYAAGGYRMMPIVDPTGRATSSTILVWSFSLLAVTIAPVFIMPGLLGAGYAAVAAVSGLAFIGLCVRLARTRTRAHARAVFFASIIHLPLLLLATVSYTHLTLPTNREV